VVALITQEKVSKFNKQTNTMEKPTSVECEHFTIKENWRITQLQNGYYQTEIRGEEGWNAVTRRTTISGAEEAIDGSVEHYKKRLELSGEPKVIKTFEQ